MLMKSRSYYHIPAVSDALVVSQSLAIVLGAISVDEGFSVVQNFVP